MLLNADYIQPVELTGYVREAQADMEINRFRLNRYLPNRFIDDLDARFLYGGEGIMDVANFRTYDAESQVGSRPGLTRVTQELPPISRKLRLGEYERLRQRANPGALVQDGLFSDAVRLTREIGARMELARGDALVNGTITLNENGVIAVVDYGRPSGNTVTAATLWSDATNADPINDLVTWSQAYLSATGENPGSILLSTVALNYVLRALKVRNVVGTLLGAPTILSRGVLSQVLDGFGLPPLDVYDAQVRVGGSATRILPTNKVVLLPAPVQDPADFEGTQLGATMWGTTAEALEPEFQLAEGDLPGVTAGVYSTDDPVALWTKAAGIGLPVLANPVLSFAATVA
jgi:hypothetical protein